VKKYSPWLPNIEALDDHAKEHSCENYLPFDSLQSESCWCVQFFIDFRVNFASFFLREWACPSILQNQFSMHMNIHYQSVGEYNFILAASKARLEISSTYFYSKRPAHKML